MRLKKILIGLFVMVMTVVATSPIAANAGVGGGATGGSQWDVLVLVLPNARIENKYTNKTQITTMHQQEIDKVTKMAKDIEKNWSNGHLSPKVDVKVDWTSIESQSFSMAMGYTIEAGNIEKQIKANVPEGKYDSVLVVYRAVDDQENSSIALNRTWSSRNKDVNGATYATLPLKDGDHKMAQFNKVTPEQDMVSALLQGVYSEMKKTHPEISSVPFSSDPAYNVHLLKCYMYIDSDGVSPYWREFV